MLDKPHIERVLRLNGIEPSASVQEIKSVLIRARWHEEDVETAILVLQDKVVEKQNTAYTAAHALMDSDKRVAPETLHSLLGVDVVVNDIKRSRSAEQETFYKRQIISLVIITILCASAFLFFVMWQMNLGLFSV